MSIQRVRFVEGPWDGRITDIDVDQYQGRRLTIPVPPKIRVPWFMDTGPVGPAIETFTYGYVELPEYGWYGLPGSFPVVEQVQTTAAVAKGHPDQMDWERRRTWAKTFHFMEKQGFTEIPGTQRGWEEEDCPNTNEFLFRATVWAYK